MRRGQARDELPEGLRERGRLERLKKAKAQLDEAERKEKEAQQQKLDERRREVEANGQRKRGRKPKALEAVDHAQAKANLTGLRFPKTRARASV